MEILIDIIQLVITLIGVILGYSFLRTKLIASNISQTLELIQNSNRNACIKSQLLMDELESIFRNTFLEIDELKLLIEKVNEIYFESLNSSREVITYLRILKIVLDSYSKQKLPNTENKKQLINFVSKILMDVVYYGTQAVSIPKSSKTKSERIINKKVERFVTNSSIQKYKHFNIGVDPNNNSAHLVHIFHYVNRGSNLFCYAASEVVQFKFSTLIFLFNKEIYVPVLLRPIGKLWLIEKMTEFQLIKITELTVYDDVSPKFMVKLLYKNTGSAYLNFNGNHDILKGCLGFDLGSGIGNLPEYTNFKEEPNYCFSVEVLRTDLESMFIKNRALIIKKLKGRKKTR